jgi:hypothetical protein
MHHWNEVSEDENKGNIDWDQWRFIESKRRYIAINEALISDDIY